MMMMIERTIDMMIEMTIDIMEIMEMMMEFEMVMMMEMKKMMMMMEMINIQGRFFLLHFCIIMNDARSCFALPYVRHGMMGDVFFALQKQTIKVALHFFNYRISMNSN